MKSLNSKLYIFVFSFLFLPINSFAKEIALVVKVRGSVTKLRPHALKASVLKKGDKLVEDTSVVTGPRSFARIRFSDNSVMNIGPNGKVVISALQKGDPGIITLLKGKLRTKVKKDAKEKKNKLLIQTRTAALGVRGTDFQTIYNPENRVTNLLTFRGKVAMAKIDNKEVEKLEKVERRG